MKTFNAASIGAITLTAILVAATQGYWEYSRQTREEVNHGTLILSSIEDSVKDSLSSHRSKRIDRLFHKVLSEPVASGLALCDLKTGRIVQSAVTPTSNAIPFHEGCQWYKSSHQFGPKNFSNWRLAGTLLAPAQSALILAQPNQAGWGAWGASALRTFAITWILGIFLLGWFLNRHLQWLRRQLLAKTMRSLKRRPVISPEVIQPQKNPLDTLIQGREIVVVANREPYIHQRNGDQIQVVRPASGLVTALEPILRTCGGLWVAHGSGSADRETSDSKGELAVPPSHPTYRLKRVWLTQEEEAGYYYGFSNEGLWPLCHLAHTRPTFRLQDWEQYQRVNQKFCESIPDSALGDDTVYLVQDYHFALLPRMLKERANRIQRRKPKISLFWHIPWPNPEAFGICPWNKELLLGMLGADVIGFHTQYHCNNFLETCDRTLECRVDWEKFSVTVENRETLVRAFPIGIETSPVRTLSIDEKSELKKRYGLTTEYIAVGVDRLDYTKGLVERVQGVERFLEKYPEYIGRFSFVQMGSPSRTHIPAYQRLADELTTTVQRVNQRFGTETYQPIVLMAHHHEWEEIQYFYQLGDICLVTSLHDGMNLVAKEYVWCQAPGSGSLILSRFAGASKELSGALQINPYSVEEVADAIAQAIRMPQAEKEARMTQMRERVQSHNAFHWATELIRVIVSEVTQDVPNLPQSLTTEANVARRPRLNPRQWLRRA